MKKYPIAIGAFCVIACLAGAGIYLFSFANKPLSKESFFWAMSIASPVALFVYLKSKMLGSALQAVFYTLAVYGAFHMIRVACLHGGECYTHSAVAVAVASLFAGVHIIAMLVATILMFVGTAKEFRSPVSA